MPPIPFPGRLRRAARRLGQSTLEQLLRTFGPLLELERLPPPQRERAYPPVVAFWGFLFQVMAPALACRHALQQIQALRLALGKPPASASTSAYCQARARLPYPRLLRIARQIALGLEALVGPDHRWMGRRVCVVDSTGISMPDTPSNQRLWPQPSGQKPGCGFPVMRVCALFSLATGAALAAVRSSLSVHDSRLFRRLWGFLRAGDVVLADRAFCSFAAIAQLAERGVDVVFRLHQRRPQASQAAKRLGRHDHLVVWKRPPQATPALPKNLLQRLPRQLCLRQLSFRVAITGFRTRDISLVTTLLDPQRFPAEALAQLFRQRWQVELNFRHIKTTMGMDTLRCQSPAMIRRELTMHLIAYNLIRALLLQAASTHHRPTHALSFKGTVNLLQQSAWLFHAHGPRRAASFRRHILRLIAADLLPHRPNRAEPRVVKRRPKPYQLLSCPRHLMLPIPHRSKYRKTSLS